MGHNIVWTLISSQKLKRLIPLSDKASNVTQTTSSDIKNILEGKSNKKIMVIWPCSADFESSLIEFSQALKDINKQFGDKIAFVMRFYTGKPRTIGGWKWIQQWQLDAQENDINSINEWLIYSRKLGIKLIEESGIGLADEMLHPQLSNHFDDIYSYLAVGARSTENQYHREVASGIYMPVWFKNPTSWQLSVMANSIKAAQTASDYTIEDHIYQSTWNEYAHGILRWWDHWSNYSLKSIQDTYNIMYKLGIKNPWILIDCSHENCKINGIKDPMQQQFVMNYVMDLIQKDLKLKAFVKGFMVESYLFDGNQSIPENINNAVKWLSLTDPCIWLDGTQKLLLELYSKI